MPYESIVYRILIASPSDVDEEREVVARIIQDWNDLNSFSKKIVLLPVRWETHTSPTYGVRPQETINRQIVDECDMLIGFFWTKIGTPTGEEIGGTVEEIKRVSKAGKPVMLYFSKRGKDPSLINIEQLEALNKFREEILNTALVETFNTLVDFRDKLSRQLEMKIREIQDNKQVHDSIDFSFIDIKSGKELGEKFKLKFDCIEVKEKHQEHIKFDSRVTNSSRIHYHIDEYLTKKNGIPIVLGVRNKLTRLISNVTLELEIKSSESDSLKLHIINTKRQSNLRQIFRNDFMEEDFIENAIKMFEEDYVQLNDKVWHISVDNSVTLIPEKFKIIDFLILIFPSKPQHIDFSITLFSDNLLKPIKSKVSLDVDINVREIKESEITELIEYSNDKFDFF